MKTKLFFATMCCVLMTLVSCERQNQPDVAPAPPCLDISGKVTNSDGQPLESIQITLEKSDSWWWTDRRRYSDEYGTYVYREMYYGDYTQYKQIEWPAEVTVIVTDTAGIYQSQTRTVSIQTRQRYPDRPEYADYIDGIATADFILQKK